MIMKTKETKMTINLTIERDDLDLLWRHFADHCNTLRPNFLKSPATKFGDVLWNLYNEANRLRDILGDTLAAHDANQQVDKARDGLQK